MHPDTNRMQSYLGRARNQGSSNEGVRGWMFQRLTSIALIPLCLWFVFAAISLIGADLAAFRDWLRSPIQLPLMIIFFPVMLHHAQQGVCEVFHEYVHNKKVQWTAVIIIKFLAVFLAVACVAAVFRVAFGG